jgi:hypothetical protein
MKIWGLRMGHFVKLLILAAPRVRRDSLLRGLGQAINPAGAARAISPNAGAFRAGCPSAPGARFGSSAGPQDLDSGDAEPSPTAI